MTKLLYCIRHGTALHNVNFWKMGRKAYTDFKDTPLIDKGKIEAIKLGTDWKDLFNVELVLVSPLSRTLDTAKYVFQNYDDVPIIALDELMEHPQAEELCNQRFDKTELVNRYPNIDFSNIFWKFNFIILIMFHWGVVPFVLLLIIKNFIGFINCSVYGLEESAPNFGSG